MGGVFDSVTVVSDPSGSSKIGTIEYQVACFGFTEMLRRFANGPTEHNSADVFNLGCFIGVINDYRIP